MVKVADWQVTAPSNEWFTCVVEFGVCAQRSRFEGAAFPRPALFFYMSAFLLVDVWLDFMFRLECATSGEDSG